MPTVTYPMCALPGCQEPVRPGPPMYRLGGNEEVYHSRGCVTIAFELMRQGKKFKKAQAGSVAVPTEEEEEAADRRAQGREKTDEATTVRARAEEFGGADVYRRYCDACGGPVTICWPGRSGGEFCSRACQLDGRPKEKDMTTEETTEETSPIAAGAPAASKKGGKAAKKAAAPAAKKATAKKAVATAKPAKPAKAAGDNARSSFPKDAVIHIPKPIDHGRRGKAGQAFDLLKDGMTVEKYREAVGRKNPKNGSWYAGYTLKFCVDEGLIKIK